jgi:large subunit ribosomal protein L17
MKKRKQGRKLSRKTGPRKALLKSLISALILDEKIETSQAKAKEISRMTEKYITKAKKGDIAARRLLTSYLSDRVAKKLVTEIAPRYNQRKGGYTRIIKLGQRKSDAAKMAIIELIK